MSTRRAVAALVLGGLLATSGCLGFITGSEALSFESQPVSVSDSAQQQTNYQQTRKKPMTVNRTFSAAGQSRTVTVTNHVAEYARAVDAIVLSGKVARFTVFSTPEVNIFGRTLNPLAKFSNRELAMRLQNKYGSIQNLTAVGNRSVTVLGEGRTVSKFRGTATTEGGQEVEVYLHVTKFKHGDDFIVAVAVYPTKVDEQGQVNTLLQGVQHETEGE